MELKNIKDIQNFEKIDISDDTPFTNKEIKYDFLVMSKNYLTKYKSKIKIICMHLVIFIIILLLFINKKPKITIIKTFIREEEVPQSLSPHLGDKFEESNKYIDLCLNGILIDKNVSTYVLSERPKVSIIIAIYNKESYIIRTLRSIQNQPLKDIEIIFVDDCSTDNSLNILKDMQKEDNRIRIIHNEKNIGVLRVREKGVRSAKGEYVFIMDGDDLLLEHGINDGYQIAELKDLDIVEFNNYDGEENLQLGTLGHTHKSKVLYRNEIKYGIFRKENENELGAFCFSVWRYLFRREVLIKGFDYLNTIYTNHTGINYYDDTAIQFSSVQFAKSYQFINVPGYYWVIDSISLTHSQDIPHANRKVLCFTFYAKLIYKLFNDGSPEGNILKGTAMYGALLFISKQLEYFTEGYDELIKTLDLFINDENISKGDRENILNHKNFIVQRFENKNITNNSSML